MTVRSSKTYFFVEAIRYVAPRYRRSTKLPRRVLLDNGGGNTLIIITAWFAPRRRVNITIYIITAEFCKIYVNHEREHITMSCLDSVIRDMLDWDFLSISLTDDPTPLFYCRIFYC